MTQKYFIRTFGCQMNEYDSAKMADILAAGGLTPAAAAEDADVVVLNTCSVREKAAEKVFSDLGRLRKLKDEKPNLLIGVGGCVASQEGEAIVERAPFVDVVFGPQTLHRLPQLIARRQQTRRPQVDIRFPEIEKFDHLPPPKTGAASSFLSIMEGCSKYCSFCVVPYTRGEEVSRPLAAVVQEAAALTENGARELTLLGQNVNAYKTVHNGVAMDFADLLACLAELPGVARIRYTTSHPVEFSQRLIDAHAALPALAQHVHLPAQSGSDMVLSRMKRGYTALEYKSIIRRLRRARPNIAVSSDFIVGFPGESEKDFAKTLDLIDAVGFDFSFSFLYSPRPGTPAAGFEDSTPVAVKKERLARLQAKINESGKRIGENMVGRTETVLAEGRAKRGGGLCGRASNNRVVNFAGEESWIGKFLPVRITRAAAHSLVGKAAGEPF